MDALPLIIGAGIAIFAFSKSSSSSKSLGSDTKKSGEGEVEIKKGLIDVSKIPSKQIMVPCTTLQYRNDKGECVDFWIDGVTDEKVSKELDLLIDSKYKGLSWDKLCSDSKKDFEFVPNSNALAITKQVILTLWKPLIKASMLPPNKDSFEYVKTIWKKVTDIYFKKVCGL